ncbi:MAG: hypothetical protein ACP5D2_04090 [Candidatus Nanoarchaeia archaeon]
MTRLEKLNKEGNIELNCGDIRIEGTTPKFADLCRVKIKDPDNKRWTDAVFGIRKIGNITKACVTHEKGYPSEQKVMQCLI